MFKHTKTNLVVSGIIMLAAGIFCLASPEGTLASLAWILGVLFIVSGVLTFFLGRRKSEHIDTLHLVAAILLVAVGIIIIVQHDFISILVGLVVMLEGIDFTAQSVRYHRAGVRHWGVMLAIGVLVILLGLWAVLSHWVGATLLSVIIGIGCLGISADCFLSLAGIKRVEGLVEDVKTAIQKQTTATQEFQEAVEAE